MLIRGLLNACLFALAMVVSLIAAEGVSRLLLDPIDFLLPELGSDPDLNHRIVAGSSGHDEWGFRNDEIPINADILAIGDSMTYGVAATYRQSWPAHLAALTGLTVYNMALGGYGPMHYLKLLETKGFNLRPETVVVGVYFGNDFMDAYNLVYSNERYAAFRASEKSEKVDPQSLITDNGGGEKLFSGLRQWFAQHSLIYRLLTQSSLGNLVRKTEIESLNENVIRLEIPGGYTFMTPDSRYFALDLEDPKIMKGYDLTLAALSEIGRRCADEEIRLVIALIPTKELVYLDTVKSSVTLPPTSKYDLLIQNELRVRDRLIAFLSKHGIEYVDLLGTLRTAASDEAIYPVNDGHPNGLGYLAIAQRLREQLVDRSE